MDEFLSQLVNVLLREQLGWLEVVGIGGKPCHQLVEEVALPIWDRALVAKVEERNALSHLCTHVHACQRTVHIRNDMLLNLP